MRFENHDFSLKYVNIITPSYPNISSIKVNAIEVPYHHVKEIKYKYDFTVCITALHSKLNATTLLNQQDF